ncbi:MAG: DUF5777 family beta-barrel protein [Cytophagaceae bacterium]|nr:DUF5777 family beta-barrel protein [Cytophagaceae bacterium]
MKYIFLCCLSWVTFSYAWSQDLMSMVEPMADSSIVKDKSYVTTFKSSRIVNVHSVELSGKNTLEFRISHRFGEVSTGSYNLWGIDAGANIRLALEYSPSNRFQVGVGRSSYQKQLDGFLKARLTRQTTDGSMPVSITAVLSGFYTALKDNDLSNGNKYDPSVNRYSYSTEIIIGRKFSDRLSLQLSPVWVHWNYVPGSNDPNDIFILSGSGRYKFTKRMGVIAEYGYVFNPITSSTMYQPFNTGIEFETGGHVFQLTVGNSFGITTNQTLSYTTSPWSSGGWRIGFNVSRSFYIGKKSEHNKIH